ncbi:lectin [Frondihabitans australicus]|uniref:Putative alpha-1,2-mannosidase n=1 Tax=Frondihabitans australicus TaxID=386892 RepID=A0A495IAE8_9MICO|nr:lectin [Frondihabitans australicus]RKR72993.1 putative alpha-1,2-mannosidase [Frondihabitans australicus]
MAVRPRRIALGASVAVIAAGVFVPGVAAQAATPYVASPASLVDPIIGTSGAVDDFPGADVPFGMVQWSPDTPSRPSGGGYEYNDKTVTGFSLTHISGPGCAASGDVPILPTSGALGSNPGAATLPLDHSAETAQAGYYKLAASGITTELTTSLHTGSARFTFPKNDQSNLTFKLSDSAAGSSSTRFQVISPTEVQGSVTSGNFCGATDKYTVNFDMVFDQPITGYGTYQNSTVQQGAKSLDITKNLAPRVKQQATLQPKSSNGVAQSRPDVSGKATPSAGAATPKQNAVVSPPVSGADGAYVSFDTSSNQQVQANVGISYVSTANAKKNRVAEDPSFAFDAQHTAATKSWNDMLSKIQIGGGDTTAQKTFYTAMYHALLHPNVFSDVNGQYEGFDNVVHTAAKGHAEYANYSGWDIYRSQVQLAAMVAPQQTSDSIRSMLNQYDQTGQLPKWALNNGESYVMVGDPSDAIIADAYAFGATDFNTAAALKDMETEATTPNNVRPGLTDYLDTGYLPLDGTYSCCNYYGAVSTQQEYNTADHAISTFAAALGKKSVAQTYAARSNNWENVFNPASNYLEPKLESGAYAAGFTPTSSNGFVEGSSAQYTPMEPFDIKGLSEAAGGNAAWIAKLDSLTSTIKNPTAANADFGNEPSIEIPWEYDYVGAPYRTQEVVRQIQQQIFTNQPAGIAGNDDLGTMSAWYVWSALGFYPETPGTTDLALGSPVFAKAAIHLPSGKTLTITGNGASVSNPYVQSMTSAATGAKAASWSHAYLQPGLITSGGTVNFTLGSTPNTSFASAAADAPPSDTTGLSTALGFAKQSVVVTQPGTPATVTIGARNLTAKAQTVSWTGAGGTGVTVGPTSGSLVLKKSADGTAQVSVNAPTTEGRYDATFSFRDATGNPLPKVVVEIDVAKPGSLWPYYNDQGVASDGASTSGSFDGEGWSYSQQALAAAGVTAGGTVTSNGLSYTFPTPTTDGLDNIQAGGQTVPLAGAAGATRFGILGAAANGNPGSEGTFVITYTDGSTQSITMGLTDWTLNGGGATTPADGNTIAATTPYRDTSSGGRDTVNAYLFTADAALQAGKTVQSVTLPSTVTNGSLHVFAFAVGTPAAAAN